MDNRLFKASAAAAIVVIVVYFVITTVGTWQGSWRIFLPLDLAVYFSMGFLATRYLSDWRRAIIVVVIAGLLDGMLAMGSVAVRHITSMSLVQAALPESADVAVSVVTGTIGAIVSAALRKA